MIYSKNPEEYSLHLLAFSVAGWKQAHPETTLRIVPPSQASFKFPLKPKSQLVGKEKGQIS